MTNAQSAVMRSHKKFADKLQIICSKFLNLYSVIYSHSAFVERVAAERSSAFNGGLGACPQQANSTRNGMTVPVLWSLCVLTQALLASFPAGNNSYPNRKRSPAKWRIVAENNTKCDKCFKNPVIKWRCQRYFGV